MRFSILFLFASLLVSPRAQSEDIFWVTLNAVDVVDPADHAFTDILTGAGHNVTRFQLNAQGLVTPDVVDQFNNGDLVILGRANNSGNYNSAQETNIWNIGITVPVISLTPYVTRTSRFGWQDGTALPDAQVATPLVAADPNHPILTGVGFAADGVTMVNNYNTPVDRGTSTMGDAPVAGGITILTNPTLANGNGVALAEWPAGTTVTNNSVGAQVLAGARYFYAAGSREANNIPIESSTIDLTVDGRRIYYNLVHYAMGMDVPLPGDFNVDGTVNVDDFMVLGSNLAGHLDGAVGFPHGDIDLDNNIDLDDFDLFHSLYPQVVAQAHGIPEPSSGALLIVLLVASVLARGRTPRIHRIIVCMFLALLILSARAVHAQLNSNWVPTAPSNYNVNSNWDVGAVPDIAFMEISTINNGGTAFLEASAPGPTGGVVLGQSSGDAGTLEIGSGGELIVENAGGSPDGTVRVGMDGEGHLVVLNGGTLTAAGLNSGGAAASSIVFGQAGGNGTVSVNINAATNNSQQRVNLQRTTRIVGPDVDFNVSFVGNAFNLSDTHSLVAEITGLTHSSIDVVGTARLDGQLTVELNGHTPAAGQSWTLVDATTILGEFSSLSSTFVSDPGHGLFIDYESGGTNGMTATLSYDPRLQLSVDRNTGTALLHNLTSTESFDINGYLITSTDETLIPDGWTSLADSDANWNEFNPAANHMSELNLRTSRVIGPESMVSLGPIFTPPGANGTLGNVTFSYHEAGGTTRLGLVGLVDIDVTPPGITGDYDASNQVEQGDLDLVLLNWGSQTPPVPTGWTNDLPEGIIDQAELDRVLLNWGNTVAALSAANVPEPASWIVAAVVALTLAGSSRWRPRNCWI